MSQRTLPSTPPPSLPDDDQSLGEAFGLANGADLSDITLRNRMDAAAQAGRMQRHKHNVGVCGMYLIWALGALMLVALVAHYIFPDHFLTAAQAGDLHKFLFSGGVGYLARGAAKGKKQKNVK